jgi:hypothetical protein
MISAKWLAMTFVKVDKFLSTNSQKDSDLFETTIFFEKDELGFKIFVYPESSIRMLLSALIRNPDNKHAFRNNRTENVSSNVEITLEEFDVLENDVITVWDWGCVS